MLTILQQVWLGPWSLIGIAIAFLTGARPVRREGDGWLWRAEETSLFARVLGRFGFVGQTLGEVIIIRAPWFEVARIRSHELEHVRQGLTWGFLFPVAYGVAFLWAMATSKTPGTAFWRGYWDCIFEREARAVEAADREI
jgi:hypothetical protein